MSLPVFQFAITDFEGNALPGANVTVTRENDGSYAEIYSDRESVALISALGTTATDDDGVVEFYLAPGVYRVLAERGAFRRTYKYLTVHPLDGLVTEPGTARTLKLADAGNYIRFTAGTAITCTIPAQSSVNFPIGAEIKARQAGAGSVTFSPAAGVTVNAPFDGSTVTPGQGANVFLRKVAADEWDVVDNKVNSGDMLQSNNLSDVASVSASRTNLGLGSAAEADIVGTVSQSAGVPTGDIIERGSNASGEYVKLADGTLLLSGVMDVDLSSTGFQSMPLAHAVASGSVRGISWQFASGVTSTNDDVLHLLMARGTAFQVRYEDSSITPPAETVGVGYSIQARWF